MQSGKSFDLAEVYLEQSNGNTWQDQIARFFTGKIDEQTLRKRAHTKGQKVEADYYIALMYIINDNFKEAVSLFKKVIDSELMGFFEYIMAKALLVTR
jgi:lipoprotein NlpI